MNRFKKQNGVCTEDRKVTGLNLIAPLHENITLVTVRQFRESADKQEKETDASNLYIDRFGIKTDSCESQVKIFPVAITESCDCKWLLDPDIIIMDDGQEASTLVQRDIYLLMGIGTRENHHSYII